MAEKEEKGARHFHFAGPCTYIEKQEVTVQAGGTFYNGPKPEPTEGSNEGDDKLVDLLTPIFFGDSEKVKSYLKQIQGCKPTQVVAVTRRYLQERAISDASCHTPLWTILHDNGLYNPSLSNWNSQLNS